MWCHDHSSRHTWSTSHTYRRVFDSPIEGLLDRLRAQGSKLVMEVPTIPRSRHYPEFNCETLPQTLRQAGIGDTHLTEPGGARHGQRDSPNMGWRNPSFRGYADDRQTPEFEVGLDTLMTAGEREPVILTVLEDTVHEAL